ncbi:hypothetical protein K9M41_02990 [Candidatus Gracilibacteria bacterium]|nr:hypothetical protein [Candidatus Gracilibacteria bacterium]
MKKLAIIGFVFLLVGCGTNNSSNIGSEQVETVGVGEVCGGLGKMKCQPGLECLFDVNSADLSGVCRKTVTDPDLECSKDKKPVCGLKERQKNGYLNECEAERHGAEIVYERFCEIDENVKGNCAAKVRSIGNCEALFTGYEFDGQSCQQVKVTGCEGELPFGSMMGCKEACE